jgi:energy-coupling factor transporter ATP-binding protein EcfA2
MSRQHTYRKETIDRIFRQIEAGECCNIVGINGMGKTNLVKHLSNPTVIEQNLSAEKHPVCFVVLDINLLVDWTSWGFFEGLADALVHSVGNSSDQTLSAVLHESHEQIIHARGNDALSLRCCAKMVDKICQSHRLVLIFDEFDVLFTAMSEHVLRHLRGLRDRYKYQLIYVTLARHSIHHLRSDEWEIVEPFVELFSLAEIGLPPLNAIDAAAEVDRYVHRYRSALDPSGRERVIASAGGHPALLRALTYEALDNRPPPTMDEFSTALRLECSKIWNQLTGDEQDALLAFVSGAPLNREQASMLTLKGLIREHAGSGSSIFSPLLLSYMRQMQSRSHAHTLFINQATRQVIYYDRDISELAPLEYKLLLYTYQRWGEMCSIRDVAEAIYVDDHMEDDYDRLRVLARRLARRLRQYVPDEPCLFTIHRGAGYRVGFPLQLPQ